jgi:hypothetical protein
MPEEWSVAAADAVSATTIPMVAWGMLDWKLLTEERLKLACGPVILD